MAKHKTFNLRLTPYEKTRIQRFIAEFYDNSTSELFRQAIDRLIQKEAV